MGPVAVAVARLGLADAGGPRPRVAGVGHGDLPRPRRQGLRRLHAVAAHFGRPGQRPAAHAARPVSDRLRRRLARPVAAGDRRGIGEGRPAAARRHAGGLVLRCQRVRPPRLRPGNRTNHRRHLRRWGRQHQLGRRVDDPRAAHDARARRQPRRGGGRPGGDHHRAGRDDDAAGGGRQHDRRRTRRHPGGPLDGRVALRRAGLPRPRRRGDRLAVRARRRCGPPGDAGGRPGARQHRDHHLVCRRQAAGPCPVGRHRSAGCLPGAWSAAPRDAAWHAAQAGDGTAGDDVLRRRRRGQAGRGDARAAGVPLHPRWRWSLDCAAPQRRQQGRSHRRPVAGARPRGDRGVRRRSAVAEPVDPAWRGLCTSRWHLEASRS